MRGLKQALERIVIGRDFSLAAAKLLEGEISQLVEDERFSELADILASYRPGGGEFLYDESALERECTRVLDLI